MSKTINEIRQIFLDFFVKKGHKIIKSSSLIPNDNSGLLFTNAGMNQFKDIFLGLDDSFYKRIVTSQRCVRAGGKNNDLEKVGYTTYHHTFFEMLGNFSFNDYFKRDAIWFSWELLTSKKWFGISKERLWITVYYTDNETYDIWVNEIKVSSKRIIRINDNKGNLYHSDNFWKMNDTGPCGPCSEIFYDYGENIDGDIPGSKKYNGNRYVEIWNLVFIQFNRQSDGTMLPLSKFLVDTGMGLERVTSVLQNVYSNYDIDLFKKLIDATSQIIGNKNIDNISLRIITDHIRSCSFLISDGVVPSNEGRGYVLRKIIRRAIRYGNILNINNIFFYKLVSPLIDIMGSSANQIKKKQKVIERILFIEEEQFTNTLEKGLALLNKKLLKITNNTLDAESAFNLYDTYGFPLDLTSEICSNHNILVDKKGFKKIMEFQRKRSRKSSSFNYNYKELFFTDKITNFLGYEKFKHFVKIIAIFCNNKIVNTIHENENAVIVLDETPFYGESGGQVGDTGTLKSISGLFLVENTKRYGKVFYHIGKVIHGELKCGIFVVANIDIIRRKKICLNHTATHLLNATIHKILGKSVLQKGSFISDKYLRFDFSHNKIVDNEQIYCIEEIINEQIRKNICVQTDILELEEAYSNKNIIALFKEKYEKQVRVLKIGDFSIELCSGNHVNRTGDIGLFRIISECSVSAGVRRIIAVTGEEALKSLHKQNRLIYQISNLLKSNDKTLINNILKLKENYKKLEKNIQQLNKKQVFQEIKFLKKSVYTINGINVLLNKIDCIEPKMLRIIVKNIKNQLKSVVIVIVTLWENKIRLIAGVTKDLTNKISAYDIISYLTKKLKGKGGGYSDLAQAEINSNKIIELTMLIKSINEMLIMKL